ncbi:zinc finger, PHD-type containing protein [Tanacetum coccineum]
MNQLRIILANTYFYLHIGCALLLPRMIIHKFNKHPLTLRYEPVENHLSEYFCEICVEELNLTWWLYHCSTCAESMHTACVPIKQECEQAVYRKGMKGVYDFINVKFGGTYEIGSHPHRVSLIQGTTYHGCCERCSETLKSKMILKCLTCKFVIDFDCADAIESDDATESDDAIDADAMQSKFKRVWN